ncbi:MAG TPA: 2Fe-2S iron-sulfur cluster-binding protein [Methylibium sp.]|nr:2Fe-2S iron-sulfur cluster-binding protein [Methylibium sp.]
MGTLFVQTRSGDQLTLTAQAPQTLLEVLRAGNVDEVLALCGGSCSCATCHVIVDPGFADRLAPMGADEDALLDSSDHRTPTSRLSCQIVYRDELDGLRVTVAPAD